ncbi:tRNA (adenosine(37)-N6)-dimethylallyltransferase MiaA [Bifidobacterium aquikefiri]|uniref:tRNA (adenosine(37)-N6)-dimethylallyltransferase MiaA n=1 Tax=Bifidobacterium aquikefiri TaxID=1653207 RepID=UPI0039EBCFAE
MPTLLNQRVISIVGPTATGKTDLAINIVRVFRHHDMEAEIINADAYQMYAGMDIGTAKPSPAQLYEVRHHLMGISDPHVPMTVARFQKLSRACIDQLQQRNIRPILVGGSGLYSRAAVDEMSFPGTDPHIREHLERRAAIEGPTVLFAELQDRDPIAASRMDPRNLRRTIRALEVIEITGKAYSANLPHYSYKIPTIQIGLDIDREELDRRIDIRTAAMIRNGLLEEARGMRPKLGLTAVKALGYKEMFEVLDGSMTLEEAQKSIAQKTKRLARKQMGWFGRDPRIHWIQALDPQLVEKAIQVIIRADQGEFDGFDAEADTYASHHLGDTGRRWRT